MYCIGMLVCIVYIGMRVLYCIGMLVCIVYIGMRVLYCIGMLASRCSSTYIVGIVGMEPKFNPVIDIKVSIYHHA